MGAGGWDGWAERGASRPRLRCNRGSMRPTYAGDGPPEKVCARRSPRPPGGAATIATNGGPCGFGSPVAAVAWRVVRHRTGGSLGARAADGWGGRGVTLVAGVCVAGLYSPQSRLSLDASILT